MGPRQALAEPEASAIQVNISPEELQKEVDKAIVKGVSWTIKSASSLISDVKNSRRRGEELAPDTQARAAFIAAVLAKCNVSPKNRTLKQLVKIAEELPIMAGTANFDHAAAKTTYGVSSLLMAYGYTYLNQDREFKRKDLPMSTRVAISLCTDLLIKNQTEEGGWSYPSIHMKPDASNSQFAAEGLRAAQALGERIPSSTFLKMADFALSLQTGELGKTFLLDEADLAVTTGSNQQRGRPTVIKGSSYMVGYATQSNVAANIFMISVALEGITIYSERSQEGVKEIISAEARKTYEEAIYSLLAWLQEKYSFDINTGDPDKAWHYYSLTSIERALGILGRNNIGTDHWRALLSQTLLREQQSSGNWPSQDVVQKWETKGRFTEEYQTIFALLALNRTRTTSRVILTKSATETETAASTSR
ncbi:MAG: hypothetical protein R3A13_10370 [Bdellovibrionota bacterium]